MKKEENNKYKLTILDDYFPNLRTGFRVSEFNYYLKRYQDSIVFSTRCDMHLSEYSASFPQFKDRIKPFTQFDWAGKTNSLFYTVFLSNAYNFNFVYELFNKPFIFELYPGGGYWINDAEVDAKLIKVLQSPLLKKVIVTQKMTYDYILNRGFATPDKIAYIYGMVTYPQYFNNKVEKKFYGRSKKSFDICFVANKYMDGGIDKGYDIFIDVCKKLASAKKDILFHVVGNFEKDEINVDDIDNRIIFHGPQDHNFFPEFYSMMDIIISPNIPFVLIPGKSYDGFPTGCCIDAGLHNVAVFCTDELQQNTHFKHKKDIFIIRPNAHEIADSIMGYYKNPRKLYKLSSNGQKKFKEVFDFEKQMRERAAVLDSYVL